MCYTFSSEESEKMEKKDRDIGEERGANINYNS